MLLKVLNISTIHSLEDNLVGIHKLNLPMQCQKYNLIQVYLVVTQVPTCSVPPLFHYVIYEQLLSWFWDSLDK